MEVEYSLFMEDFRLPFGAMFHLDGGYTMASSLGVVDGTVVPHGRAEKSGSWDQNEFNRRHLRFILHVVRKTPSGHG